MDDFYNVLSKLIELKDDNTMYIFGCEYYIEKDYIKARKVFEEAAKLGNSSAINDLGYMYLEGLGMEKDYDKARKLFEEAVKLGNSYAINDLGYMYLEGLGMKKDYDKARKLFEEAVKLGDSAAMNNLGYMYREGLGVEKDYDKARKLFEEAVKFGDSAPKYNLAKMYQEGLGVSKDYNKAKELYEQAYQNGIQQAKDKLDEIIKLLEFTFKDENEKKIQEENLKINNKNEANKKAKGNYFDDYMNVVRNNQQSKANLDVEKLKELIGNLCSKYVSREQTIKMLANNIYHARKVIESIADEKIVRHNLNTILLISSTGGGKTAIVSDLAKNFDVPFVSVPISSGYTQAGYKGLELNSIFANLINAANGDLNKAEKGIILLDEFDKIRIFDENDHDNQFKKALQHELLSYLEGRKVQIINGDRQYTFDTSKVTFILSGAFQDITQDEKHYAEEEIKEKISEGYEAELLGRINVCHYMPKYTKEDYINILNNSKIGALNNFITSCSIYGKSVITSPYSAFVESVAEEAVRLDKGVRGLNNIFSNILNWYLDDLIYGEGDIVLMESFETIKRKKGKGM